MVKKPTSSIKKQQLPKIENKNENYKIISKAKKTASKEEELKKKWIDFKIDKDKEREKYEQLLILQEEFKVQRSKRKTLADY